MMAPREKQDDHSHHHSSHSHSQLRALAARAVTDSLRAAAASRSCSDAADASEDRDRRYRECVRSLKAEKAKMEVFRRELPISVHLVADVIEWLKEELAQHRRRAQPQTPAPELFAPAAAAKAPTVHAPAPSPQQTAAKDDGGAGVKDEGEENDKRSWMSSAQLQSCGASHHDDSTANGAAAHSRPSAAHKDKVSSAFMPTTLPSLPTLARSPGDASAKPAAMPCVPDLSLSSPAAAPSATSSAVTDAAGAQQRQLQQQQQAQQQRKARRCWSPELHRRFVAALQRLGGAQVATPKQIRELMKVDGLTNDEVKSHLQKYRLHTRRATSSDGGEQMSAAAGGLWSSAAAEEQQQQYATSQHSTSQSQSGSPQGPLQLTTVSASRATTAGDSCDGGDEAEGGGKSESYGGGGGWEMTMHHHRHGTTKASSS